MRALALVLLSVPAAAQEQTSVVHAEGVDPLRATPVQVEQAQSRFQKGKQLYDEGRFEEALAEFGASRAIVASPNARLYRARCLVQLGQKLEAYAEYGRTMVQALELAKQEVRYQRTAEAATQERAELERDIAFVRVNVHRAQPATRLLIGGEEIRRQAWAEPVPTTAGEVTVELVTSGYPTRSHRLVLRPGQSEEIMLDVGVEPATAKGEAPSGSPRESTLATRAQENTSLMPYAYGALGVGVLGVGAFAVLGSMSADAHASLEERCPDGICAPSERDTLDAGRSQQLWANVGLAVGVVGLGAGVTLWALEDSAGDGSEQSVGLSLKPTGLAVWGRM